jgi:2-polyprenyl-6-methoxyphenol hydroxylase-like FAD-dependent oxidoreductase
MEVNVAIVGGGLSGFAVGIGLLQKGFTRVKIYERDECMDSRRQGYGLTILQGISALKHLGVIEEVKRLDTPSRSHFMFRSDGKMVGFFGTAFWATSTAKSKKKYNLHIGRQGNSSRTRTSRYRSIRTHSFLQSFT